MTEIGAQNRIKLANVSKYAKLISSPEKALEVCLQDHVYAKKFKVVIMDWPAKRPSLSSISVTPAKQKAVHPNQIWVNGLQQFM